MVCKFWTEWSEVTGQGGAAVEPVAGTLVFQGKKEFTYQFRKFKNAKGILVENDV